MKKLVVVFLIFLSFRVNSQSIVSICSWNLKDFGQTKNDTEINFIADEVKNFDIIAIQEVVAGYGGAQAIAKLSEVLNRKGSKWDYVISDPTFSSSYKTERYAFLWKPNKVKRIQKAWLEQKYKAQIDREPYYSNFEIEGRQFTLATYHAITKSKQPETEIKYFKFLPLEYPDKNLIFSGDFNCSEKHTVFNPLKSMMYLPALKNQKTTLKESCIANDCLASEYDNFYFNSQKVILIKSGVLHFYRKFPTLQDAGFISDHLPIYMNFYLK